MQRMRSMSTNGCNIFAPPQSELLSSQTNTARSLIETLDVSQKWKRKFHLIAIAGGPHLTKTEDLSSSEHFEVRFNMFAMAFGLIYYVVKGMWRKGISLFLLVNVCAFILAFGVAFLGFKWMVPMVSACTQVIFAFRANADYYDRMVEGDNGWL
jgi:hypothetical protein